jgi:hypothetical protein
MLEGLLAALKKHTPAEIINGNDVENTAELVMLDVAFSPVLELSTNEEQLMLNPPRPTEVQQRGDRFMLYRGGADFQWVDAESLKIMRARYLLARGFYSDRMRLLPNGVRQKVIAWYFGGSVYVPAEVPSA